MFSDLTPIAIAAIDSSDPLFETSPAISGHRWEAHLKSPLIMPPTLYVMACSLSTRGSPMSPNALPQSWKIGNHKRSLYV